MSSVKEELLQLIERMNGESKPIASISAVYQFKLKSGEQHTVSINEGSASLIEEESVTVDCTVILSDSDMRKLLRNELNTTLAYMTGAIKVEGKLAHALKLLDAMKSYA